MSRVSLQSPFGPSSASGVGDVTTLRGHVAGRMSSSSVGPRKRHWRPPSPLVPVAKSGYRDNPPNLPPSCTLVRVPKLSSNVPKCCPQTPPHPRTDPHFSAQAKLTSSQATGWVSATTSRWASTTAGKVPKMSLRCSLLVAGVPPKFRCCFPLTSSPQRGRPPLFRVPAQIRRLRQTPERHPRGLPRGGQRPGGRAVRGHWQGDILGTHTHDSGVMGGGGGAVGENTASNRCFFPLVLGCPPSAFQCWFDPPKFRPPPRAGFHPSRPLPRLWRAAGVPA